MRRIHSARDSRALGKCYPVFHGDRLIESGQENIAAAVLRRPHRVYEPNVQFCTLRHGHQLRRRRLLLESVLLRRGRSFRALRRARGIAAALTGRQSKHSRNKYSSHEKLLE